MSLVESLQNSDNAAHCVDCLVAQSQYQVVQVSQRARVPWLHVRTSHPNRHALCQAARDDSTTALLEHEVLQVLSTLCRATIPRRSVNANALLTIARQSQCVSWCVLPRLCGSMRSRTHLTSSAGGCTCINTRRSLGRLALYTPAQSCAMWMQRVAHARIERKQYAFVKLAQQILGVLHLNGPSK